VLGRLRRVESAMLLAATFRLGVHRDEVKCVHDVSAVSAVSAGML
jgi:hypothetical protein